MAWDYEKQKAHVGEKNREASILGRDISPLPAIVNPERRAACARNLQLFCETYYPQVFCLEWSADHLRVIKKIETAMLDGGLFAIAMPRGSGKTSLAIVAAEWALIYGHCRFVVLIGSSEDAACELLEGLKGDLEHNDLLLEDFPEVCYPIRRLEGIVARATGQLLDGKRTHIAWTAKDLILPTVPNSLASGSAVKVAGILGRVRGLNINLPATGEKIRPDCVLIDDPQTDESARSPKQVRDRLKVVCGAVLGLAGPGKKIRGVMPVTVVEKNDMADQVLGRPEWQGERTKLMKTFPTNIKLWEEYDELRKTSLRAGRGIADATAFYVANRAAMDEGAEAAWPARFNPDEVSAIQNCMNLKLANEEAFFSEYQNEPTQLDVGTELQITSEQLRTKVTNVRRGVVPAWVSKVTAFIDVQGKCLYYAVVGWSDDFTGHVLDYGSYPDQGRLYFYLREVSKTLARAKPGVSIEGAIYEGLDKLVSQLMERRWQRDEGGDPLLICRTLIDANWGDSTDVVKKFCRESKHAAVLLASHGHGVTADKKPMNDWEKKPAERAGWNWRVRNAPGRHIIYDTNSFKSFVAQRILSAQGERGTLSIFHGTETQHRMFFEHASSEWGIPTEGNGRVVNVWHLRPNRENHLLDCLVGAAVAASEQGCLFTGHEPSDKQKRKRRKLEVIF